MSLRIHQQVFVVFWKELLHESVAFLINRLDDETTLFRLNEEGTTLVLGNADHDII